MDKPQYFYRLYVVNSRQYHEGVEYWIRPTAVEIVDCLEDWMLTYEAFGIELFQYEVEYGIDLTERFGINDESYENQSFSKNEWDKVIKKAKKLAKKIDEEYNTTNNKANDKDTYECRSCDIMTEKNICPQCKNETKNIEN